MRFSRFSHGVDLDGDHWFQCYDRGVRLRQYGVTYIRGFFCFLELLFLLSIPRRASKHRSAKQQQPTAALQNSAVE